MEGSQLVIISNHIRHCRSLVQLVVVFFRYYLVEIFVTS